MQDIEIFQVLVSVLLLVLIALRVISILILIVFKTNITFLTAWNYLIYLNECKWLVDDIYSYFFVYLQNFVFVLALSFLSG